MIHRFVKVLGLPGFALLALPVFAQDATPPLPPAPATPVGEPLPQFTLQFRTSTTIFPGGDNELSSVGSAEMTDAFLTWGDITLRAAHMTYDAALGKIEASGHIVFTRDIETIRGDSITFFLQTGSFVVQRGAVTGPQYYVSGERIERVNGVMRAYRGRIAPNSEGRSEVQITAREIRFVQNQYIDLLDMRVSLFGKRLLTLPAYRIQQRYGPRKDDFPQIPLRIKYTKISGLAFGLGGEWKLARNTQADALIFFPTKNGPQYQFVAGYDLFGTANQPPAFLRRRRHDSLFDAVSDVNAKPRGGTSPAPPGPSPLRRLLTVDKGTGPDPVLDFKSILAAPEALTRPLEEPPRYAIATSSFSDKEEYGGKRQGNLLVSRQPEARLLASLPIRGTTDRIFNTNAEARHYLEVPRFAFTTDLFAGSYIERRITLADEFAGSPKSETSQRFGGTVGVNMLPLLVGSNFLIRSNLSYTAYSYSSANQYRVPEIGASAAYVINSGTMLGAAVYHRQPSGHTPFFFDQIDTRTEAQALAQGRLSAKIDTAILLRYDLTEQRLFDWAYTIGLRGQTIEPRLSYRKLGGQFSLDFNFLGF